MQLNGAFVAPRKQSWFPSVPPQLSTKHRKPAALDAEVGRIYPELAESILFPGIISSFTGSMGDVGIKSTRERVGLLSVSITMQCVVLVVVLVKRESAGGEGMVRVRPSKDNDSNATTTLIDADAKPS